MAEPLGISASVVSEWESDKLLIRQPNAFAIEYLFGISWRWLLFGEGEMWATKLPAWISERLKAQGQAPTALTKARRTNPGL